MNKKLDFLPKINLKIYQDRQMFRINSDTVYLGEFLQFKENDVVLDIGTNNGALLLYASRLTKGKLIGVDINKEALALARENLLLNNLTDFYLYESKVQDLKIDQVDSIVCNPPYFKNSLQSKIKLIKDAKHNDSLPFEELIESCFRLLKTKGNLFLVNRVDNLIDMIITLNKYKFGIRNLKFIYDENKENAVGVLIKASKNMKNDLKVMPSIVTIR